MMVFSPFRHGNDKTRLEEVQVVLHGLLKLLKRLLFECPWVDRVRV